MQRPAVFILHPTALPEPDGAAPALQRNNRVSGRGTRLFFRQQAPVQGVLKYHITSGAAVQCEFFRLTGAFFHPGALRGIVGAPLWNQ